MPLGSFTELGHAGECKLPAVDARGEVTELEFDGLQPRREIGGTTAIFVGQKSVADFERAYSDRGQRLILLLRFGRRRPLGSVCHNRLSAPSCATMAVIVGAAMSMLAEVYARCQIDESRSRPTTRWNPSNVPAGHAQREVLDLEPERKRIEVDFADGRSDPEGRRYFLHQLGAQQLRHQHEARQSVQAEQHRHDRCNSEGLRFDELQQMTSRQYAAPPIPDG